ncbi:MAG: MBL fold metallo-hydrolase [Desulfovibrio sp.]|nr:MBL fold metallo-hydrolase [Desulfovibrio sp.]
MKARFIPGLLAALLLLAAPALAVETKQQAEAPQAADKSAPAFQIQHVRNATAKLTSGDATFLIDPMLAAPGAYEGFANTYRGGMRNPFTPLPMPVEDLLAGVDAVILTHTHLDHWDPAAQKALPKDMPLFVQHEEDAKLVRGQGFRDVRILKDGELIKGVRLERTATRHGSEAMYADPVLARALGEVMGIVFTAPDGKKAWVVGDTVWFPGVDAVLAAHRPDVIIMNAGGAAMAIPAFQDAPEIIMNKDDVLRMVRAAPDAQVVAVHMDAINHMTVDRKDLARFTREHGIRDKVLIPFDGEVMDF